MGPFASERGYTRRCGASFKPLLVGTLWALWATSGCRYLCQFDAIANPFSTGVRLRRVFQATSGGVSTLEMLQKASKMSTQPNVVERCGRCGRPSGAGISVGLTRSPTRFLPGFASNMLQRVSTMSPQPTHGWKLKIQFFVYTRVYHRCDPLRASAGIPVAAACPSSHFWRVLNPKMLKKVSGMGTPGRPAESPTNLIDGVGGEPRTNMMNFDYFVYYVYLATPLVVTGVTCASALRVRIAGICSRCHWSQRLGIACHLSRSSGVADLNVSMGWIHVYWRRRHGLCIVCPVHDPVHGPRPLVGPKAPIGN
eukprot:gene21320-biopygen14681